MLFYESLTAGLGGNPGFKGGLRGNFPLFRSAVLLHRFIKRSFSLIHRF
ncbi:hypothetical protein SCG7109_AD_00290 [Chlamydiales bacterium SCGC AG-110-M15]|nr:hypothetical protein SCG7109_AD_00290 [Chlamydiales bacterium SCGC AG-110-M15]